MTQITAIRHAEVLYRGVYEDKFVHLTADGKRAASKLIHLTLPGVKAIYSSPLQRCVETVEPLSRHLRIDIGIEQGLEELDYRGNAQEFHARLALQPEFHYEGGETLDGSNARFLDCVLALSERHADESIVISTHGTVLSQFLINQFSMPDDMFGRLGYPSVFQFRCSGKSFSDIAEIELGKL